MRHVLPICLFVCATSSAIAPDADACTQGIPRGALAKVHPSGEVAQSAQIMIEEQASSLTYVLTDATGARVPTTEVSRVWLTEETFLQSTRTTYAPDTPLAPGDYVLTLSSEDAERTGPDEAPRAVSFTVTSELPAEGAPSPPVISWRAVTHDGSYEPGPFENGGGDPCGLDSEDVHIEADFEITVPGARTAGFITLTWDEGRQERVSLIRETPSFTHTERAGADAPFIECVTATFTDVYGRTSAPTESCKPEHCVAKHANDRDPVDWADVTAECRDWSPGFAERNAPGCACAQAPGAPAGAPAGALALLALGALGLRRRR